jgi:hypothetical protein
MLSADDRDPAAESWRLKMSPAHDRDPAAETGYPMMETGDLGQK